MELHEIEDNRRLFMLHKIHVQPYCHVGSPCPYSCFGRSLVRQPATSWSYRTANHSPFLPEETSALSQSWTWAAEVDYFCRTFGSLATYVILGIGISPSLPNHRGGQGSLKYKRRKEAPVRYPFVLSQSSSVSYYHLHYFLRPSPIFFLWGTTRIITKYNSGEVFLGKKGYNTVNLPCHPLSGCLNYRSHSLIDGG